jgi:predicted TIM-barrel fold metal-dependent hydrolase
LGNISKEIIGRLKRKFFIIDTHAHIGESVGVALYLPEHLKVTSEDLIKKMEYNGTDMAIVSPLVGYSTSCGVKDTMRQNDAIAEAVEKYPDKFPCGLGIVNPFDGDKAIEEVHRIMRDLGLKGLEFFMAYQGTFINHPLVIRILKELSRYPEPVVMVHTTGSNQDQPWRLGDLAELFPNMKFISAHPNVDLGQIEQHIPFCKKLKNLYIDTALWIPEDATWLAAKTLGAERIVYGGDIGGIARVSFGLLQLLVTDIFNDEELEQILSKNAAKIFKIKI